MEIKNIEKICLENNVNLSFDMPKGYENAFGTFEPITNFLYINKNLLKNADKYKFYFFFYHELRHAIQYQKPNLFSKEIQESLPYVILYNGICYKKNDKQWLQCNIEKPEEICTQLYLNLPYELDANKFAFEKCLLKFPKQKDKINQLYKSTQPTTNIKKLEMNKIFKSIDFLTKS